MVAVAVSDGDDRVIVAVAEVLLRRRLVVVMVAVGDALRNCRLLSDRPPPGTAAMPGRGQIGRAKSVTPAAKWYAMI
jgi:hypothetical protein